MKPKFLSTAIGSMPYDNPEHAVDVSIASMESPIWPQLGVFGLKEQMEIQYSEGIPCAVIDEAKGRMYFETSTDHSEELATFYENYAAAMDPDEGNGDCSSMQITEEFSKGLYAMERKVKTLGKKIPWIKVQVTGPCSFALTLTDENKRAIYYNEEFRDVIVKAIAMKCRWQIQKFKQYADNIICFIDEPILSAFGSSTYVSVKREDVVSYLSEVIDAVHADGGYAGIHCCGNTEWSILTDAGVDMVNFDAFEYGETISLYGKDVKAHLEKERMLAWGIVPTSKKIMEQTLDSLEEVLERNMDKLAGVTGLDKKIIAEQALLTPSCGTGSLSIEEADRVFKLLSEFTPKMRKKYGF
jgi:methionine synthase II (cobalamin-independent)